MSISTEGRTTEDLGREAGSQGRVPGAAETGQVAGCVQVSRAPLRGLQLAFCCGLSWQVRPLLRGPCLPGALALTRPHLASGVGPEPAVGEHFLGGQDSRGCRDSPYGVVKGAGLGVRSTECDCRHASPGLCGTFTRLQLHEPHLPLCAPDGQAGLVGRPDRALGPCV